jgi:hypothetical protein
MYPEDRVLIGVVNRKRDLKIAQEMGWYRIPQERMPHGVYHEYIGLFLSKRAFKQDGGVVGYFARKSGYELAYRRDLLPKEANHKQADNPYYKVTFDTLQEKVPPIVNDTGRRFAFIHTTWDRFVHAQTIGDLYSRADYLVDRVYHVLRQTGVRVERWWETDSTADGYAVAGAGVRVLCQQGSVTGSTVPQPGALFLDLDLGEDALVAALRAEIAKLEGPVMGTLGTDGY